MHKRAFQALKRTFMHVSGLPPPYFDLKKTNFFNWFFESKYGGGRPETCIKRAFQDLKRTFMHVSGLPPPYFDKKPIAIYKLVFLNQNMVEEDLRHA